MNIHDLHVWRVTAALTEFGWEQSDPGAGRSTENSKKRWIFWQNQPFLRYRKHPPIFRYIPETFGDFQTIGYQLRSMHSMRSICFVWRSMGVRWGFGPLWQVFDGNGSFQRSFGVRGKKDTCFVGGNEVLGEFDQPCVRVRSLVLLNLFLLDCEGWFLPLPRGHCCERWECGLLSILDSQVHIQHRAKQVLPSSKVPETLLPWKYIFTFLCGYSTSGTLCLWSRQSSSSGKGVMKMNHLCTASLHGQIGQDIASLLVLCHCLSCALIIMWPSNLQSNSFAGLQCIWWQGSHWVSSHYMSPCHTDSASWLCIVVSAWGSFIHKWGGSKKKKAGSTLHILTHVSISTKKVVLRVEFPEVFDRFFG